MTKSATSQGLAYTSFSRELPPLGQIIAVMDNNHDIHLVQNSLNSQGERFSEELLKIIRSRDDYIEDLLSWALMPKMIPIEDELPAFGETVLVRATHDEGKLAPIYLAMSLCKDPTAPDKLYHYIMRDHTLFKVTEWLPLEALDNAK